MSTSTRLHRDSAAVKVGEELKQLLSREFFAKHRFTGSVLPMNVK
ncbi:hypothetical protein PAMC26577_32570 [Caballeronia sordidicola]|uniref:Uncharacterized protein n=1 Tax=Caballeronia sordidicola TaxID=196367 RepID=A0A242MD78_CABSO|nr:hypothetical protein PAMC26577_32570 [Caballeronia sordidicola]